MNTPRAVAAKNVSKRYLLYHKPQDRLKQSFFRHFGKTYGHEFWALRDVSFEILRGEALGIIGPNGSGKSTLLEIVAGTLTPTQGEVQVNGRVAALLELGSGFNPEFTGRENVFLNGSILGLSRSQVEARFEEIAAFADIGQFMDQPVKLYSSGMFVRLAFAVQACIEPDILIVDEALSVGDIFFQQKCMKRIQSLLEKGTSLLFVTHDRQALSTLCHRAILLTAGQMVAEGPPQLVLEKYLALYYGHSSPAGLPEAPPPLPPEFQLQSGLPLESIPEGAPRFGDGGMRILGYAIHGEEGKTRHFRPGQTMYVNLEIMNEEEGLIPNMGFQIRDRFGNIVSGTNTCMLQKRLIPQKKGALFRCTFKIQLMIGGGEYTITLAVSSDEPKPARIYDWIDQAANIWIVPSTDHRIDGLAYCPVEVKSPALS